MPEIKLFVTRHVRTIVHVSPAKTVQRLILTVQVVGCVVKILADTKLTHAGSTSTSLTFVDNAVPIFA
jgi:hypothetical protein